MMRLLILGGTGEAKKLADHLYANGVPLIYSIAGLVRKPTTDYSTVIGGFGGVEGLKDFLELNNISHIVDVTHPYADTISGSAVKAAQLRNIPCWRFVRPAWRPSSLDQWQVYDDWDALTSAVAASGRFRSIFLSVGQLPDSLIAFLKSDSSLRNVLIRSAVANEFLPGASKQLVQVGPFDLENELALLKTHSIDLIVSKNSGGKATFAKIQAARELNIPVYFLKRPALPAVDKEFSEVSALQAYIYNRFTGSKGEENAF